MFGNVKRNLLAVALGVGSVCTVAAGHAQLVEIRPTAAWGAWGAIHQSNGPNGHMVRGQLSRRLARERVFYNTTSNSGPYDRLLDVFCDNQLPQRNYNWGWPHEGGINDHFYTASDGDVTLVCESGNELTNDGQDSYAWINSR
jgi:hypothetical protein